MPVMRGAASFYLSSSKPLRSTSARAERTGRRDASGNAFCFESHLKQGRRTQAFYDVFFAH
jgi:hypothetical protein